MVPSPPSTALGDPGEDDAALGQLLAATHQQARRALNESLGHLGIEARHYGVLTTLHRNGPCSQRRLSALLGLDKSAMVRLMDELERRGLATRNRDRRDRRAYAIELTPEGRAKARESDAAAAAVGSRLFGWIAPDDRARLVAILTGILNQATDASTGSGASS